jgi:hypothetical protein
MSRRILALSLERTARPAALAGGILAITLLAGCGSSGGGTVAGSPPTASPSTSPTEEPTGFPGPSSSPTGFPGPSSSPTTTSLRDFDDATSGISLRVPPGYVVATTPAEAASRFPDVLGGSTLTASKIKDAQDRLRDKTLMIAFHPPIGGQFDNIGFTKTTVSSSADPADLQKAGFATTLKKQLATAGALGITVTPIDLDGVPAVQVGYRVKRTSQLPVYGEQFYVVSGAAVYTMTITTGTSARAQNAADYVSDHWTLS